MYADRKPYHEFWFGEAVPKAMPSWIHGMLQFLMMRLLREIGYKGVASEVMLRLSPYVCPLPDVIATSGSFQLPYPTKPFDVAIEILSPSDSAQNLFRRCRLFAQWGISHIYVLDPEERTVQHWNMETNGLEDVDLLTFAGKPSLTAQRIWTELDREIAELTNA